MLDKTSLAALAPGRGAIITGGAGGIGLATARQLATFGMRVCIVDRDRDALKRAAEDLAHVTRGGAADILTQEADVSSARRSPARRGRSVRAFQRYRLLDE